jgi:AcrR family transcriptional regulator
MAIRVRRKAPDTYQHGDLKEALVQAGLKLLTEGGVASLTLRAAAQLAGVSHAAPYRHFADKDTLVAAIAERGFRLLTTSMRDEIARGKTDVRTSLRAAGVGYVRFAVQHPAYFRVIFAGLVPDDAVSAELRAAGAEAYAVLRGLVVAGLADGTLRAADADLLSLAAWSLVHGLGMLAINGQLQPWGHGAEAVERLALTLVRFLETGIARPS